MTCLPERDGLRWFRASDKHSRVVLNKIYKIFQSPLLNPYLTPCLLPLTGSKHTPHFCKTQSQTSSSPIPHLSCFTSRMLMPVPTSLKKSYSFALSCPQFLLENGKNHLSYEGGICQNSFWGNFWKHHFFLAYDSGTDDSFSLSRNWLKRICCFYRCRVHLTVFVLVFTCMLQKADALSFCFPDLRSPGG